MWQHLGDALFPPRCMGCGARGVWLCAVCQGRIREDAQRRQCQHGVAVTYCQRCFPEWTDLAGVRVVGTYVPPLKTAIWRLKFGGKRQSATALGQILAQCWAATPPIAIDAVVATPASALGQQQRGYNQAELLARACARTLGVPLRSHILVRTRVAPPQLGKTALERRANVAGLFAVNPRAAARVQGRRILVVDDVLTTGATLNAVAAALRAVGATEVWAVTLARPSTHER